ncbi:MAG: hypothetical protein K2K36_09900, partial [Muribaculaceae bacterium]|nr:hypothetical protein [Muribaculaceae bacterium]
PYATTNSALNDSIGGIRVYTYSIITNRALGKDFNRLASLKRQTGLDAGVIFIEDILSNPLVQNGDTISNINDDAGKLRQFLRYAAYETPLQYVLLGGKPPIVPIRYATIDYDYTDFDKLGENFDFKQVPADLYYSNLSRNWNIDGDKFYGELKEDSTDPQSSDIFNSYLYVGRLPCTTSHEVHNYIDKLEFYLLNPGKGNPNYLSSAYSHFSSEAQFYGGSLEEAACAPISRSFNDHTIYKQTEVVTARSIIQSLVAHKNGLIDYHGHSSPVEFQAIDVALHSWGMHMICAVDSVQMHGEPEDGNGLDNLDNFGYPNILYSISCEAAAFDAPNYCGYGYLKNKYGSQPCTLSESFLLGKNYGGVAFIGNSRDGWFRYSAILEARFFNAFLRGGKYGEIGGLFNASQRVSNSDGFDSFSHLGYKTLITRNLLGDPQLMLWRGIPEYVNECSVLRTDAHLQIKGAGENNYLNCEYVIVEPNGTVHRGPYSGLAVCRNISPNSSVSIIKDNQIPFICDLTMQNININNYQYVYARNAEFGSNVNSSSMSQTGNVKFQFGCEFILDASGDVSLHNGTIIQNGAKVKIMTPGTCTLDSVLIETGGTLEIHATKLIIAGKHEPSKQYLGKRILYGYDKYGLKDEPDIEVIDQTVSSKKVARNNGYKPMCEVGKEWRYVIKDISTFTHNRDEDTAFKYRIDGMTEFDNKQYYIVNAYTGDTTEPDNNMPYCWLREDADAKTVYVLPNRLYPEHVMLEQKTVAAFDSDEAILYSFENYDDNTIIREPGYGYLLVYSELEANDGIHRGYTTAKGNAASYEITSPYGCYESLGVIDRPESMDRWGEHPHGFVYDLFGEYYVPAGGPCHLPYLYAVTAPDGSEIYSCDRLRPDTGAIMRMKAENDEAEPEYYNLQGIHIQTPAPGTICIRRTGTSVEKVIMP